MQNMRRNALLVLIPLVARTSAFSTASMRQSGLSCAPSICTAVRSRSRKRRASPPVVVPPDEQGQDGNVIVVWACAAQLVS
eukprot:765712-Hanusia_phi.AAC.2